MTPSVCETLSREQTATMIKSFQVGLCRVPGRSDRETIVALRDVVLHGSMLEPNLCYYDLTQSPYFKR